MTVGQAMRIAIAAVRIVHDPTSVEDHEYLRVQQRAPEALRALESWAQLLDDDQEITTS